MKNFYLLYNFFVYFIGVFGDTEEVSVSNGDSVTLHTNITDIQTDDVITWKFNDVRIARINRAVSMNAIYDDEDERFKDRLKMNNQTGDLTITNISSQHAGVYQIDIINKEIITKTFSVNVFGDIVSVMDGGSVTLHAHITGIQGDDVIMWKFEDSCIATINRTVSINPIYSDKRFRDRLKMNPQTGDLTITNITSQHAGVYHLDSINGETVIPTNFRVSLSPKVKTVIVGDSVSLHIDVGEKQRKEKIHWKIKHKNSLVAEIMTENERVTINKTSNGFRGELKMNVHTGDLIITNMKKNDSGVYEVEVTINNSYTIHKTFSYTCSDCSSNIRALLISLAVAIAAFVAVVGVICHRIRNRADPNPSVEPTAEQIEMAEPLTNGDANNGVQPPV